MIAVAEEHAHRVGEVLRLACSEVVSAGNVIRHHNVTHGQPVHTATVGFVVVDDDRAPVQPCQHDHLTQAAPCARPSHVVEVVISQPLVVGRTRKLQQVNGVDHFVTQCLVAILRAMVQVRERAKHARAIALHQELSPQTWSAEKRAAVEGTTRAAAASATEIRSHGTLACV